MQTKSACPTVDYGTAIHEYPAHYRAAGKIESKSDEVVILSFIASNKLWDESDTFARKGELIQIYNFEDSENYLVGDTISFTTIQRNWDPNHVLYLSQESCTATLGIFKVENVSKSVLNLDIGFISFLKLLPLLLMIGILLTGGYILIRIKSKLLTKPFIRFHWTKTKSNSHD